MTDVPEPEIGINDVLIRVDRTGICGTDLHIEEWNDWAERTVPVPLVIGHEFVGEVAEVGSNVSDFRQGDLVSGEGHVVCGRCRNCMAGRRHLCADAKGIGVDRPGAFADYIALPMTNVWHHDSGIDQDITNGRHRSSRRSGVGVATVDAQMRSAPDRSLGVLCVPVAFRSHSRRVATRSGPRSICTPTTPLIRPRCRRAAVGAYTHSQSQHGWRRAAASQAVRRHCTVAPRNVRRQCL
jgi:hypothetical protein